MLQITLVIMSFYELKNNCQYWEVIVSPVRVYIMFARFICATILHLSLVDEVSAGLSMMKYAVNHPYRFNRFALAWCSGFLQTISCLTVELANIGVVQGANDTINIVFNFIALAIIVEFDNYVFASMKNESFQLLIEKDFTQKTCVIYHTTSKKCSPTEKAKVKDESGENRPLRVQFSDRTWINGILYVLYRVLRIFYVSTFYYFLPFSSIIMSTLIPLLYRGIVEVGLPICI